MYLPSLIKKKSKAIVFVFPLVTVGAYSAVVSVTDTENRTNKPCWYFLSQKWLVKIGTTAAPGKSLIINNGGLSFTKAFVFVLNASLL